MEFPTHIVAVGGIIENEKRQILLVRTLNGGWVYPGGQVEEGENLIEALSREIMEESGVAVSIRYLVGVYSNTGKRLFSDGETVVPTKVMFDFVCQYEEGELLQNSSETEDCMWVDRDMVMQYVTTPAIKLRYQAYLEYDGSVYYCDYKTAPSLTINAELFLTP